MLCERVPQKGIDWTLEYKAKDERSLGNIPDTN